jgi:hypothetical protein
VGFVNVFPVRSVLGPVFGPLGLLIMMGR